MIIKTQCKSLSALLQQIYRGNTAATLRVYGRNGTPVWYARSKGVVTLNLGKGRFATISRGCYEKVKDQLYVSAEENFVENRA